MNDFLFKDFLMISNFTTIIYLCILAISFYAIYCISNKKKNFSLNIITATIIGILIGISLQVLSGFNENPLDIVYIKEITKWYSLFGYGFMDFIRMMVIPLVFVSIVNVIINMQKKSKISKLIKNTILITMSMVFIASIIGLIMGLVFNLGADGKNVLGESQSRDVVSIVDTLRNLIPSNPIRAMVDLNIIGIVIFAIFIGIATKTEYNKDKESVISFVKLIDSLQKISINVTLSIIEFMPYAMIPLLANTISNRGLSSILEVLKFIVILYICAIIMFLIQMIVLIIFGVNPKYYIKKSIHVLSIAFTSRSSLGTLPITIDALTNRLGVNPATASFVASFGSTAGMQGCAGIFPALLIVYVSNLNGLQMDMTLFVMSAIVISIGSLGIAGIPGTGTMAATVSLSGIGYSQYFPMISPILAVDPIVDMARTALNVSGAMVNSILVDKSLKQFDNDKYIS